MSLALLLVFGQFSKIDKMAKKLAKGYGLIWLLRPDQTKTRPDQAWLCQTFAQFWAKISQFRADLGGRFLRL